MRNLLHHITLQDFKTVFGKTYNIPLSFQLFGKPLHSAPIVLVNHALTGNSQVSGENGWWKKLIGKEKVIDTEKFTVLAFNIPGNGFDGFFIDDYKNIIATDIAAIFIEGLKHLKIRKLFALIGSSVGGSIGWEILSLQNNIAQKFIPIAADYKTSDWLHSQCLVQKFLFESEEKPLEKARIHAMLCYRTPQSINFRFKNQNDTKKQIRKSEDWLNFHGRNLNERFGLRAYKLMNHLLMNINATEEKLKKITSEIHLVSVDTDLFYPAFEIKKTYEFLKQNHQQVFYHEIKSTHGHDAFLMEYEQLNQILTPIFHLYDNNSKYF